MTKWLTVAMVGLLCLGLAACSEKKETQCVALSEGCAGVDPLTLGGETWYTEATGQVVCAEILYVKAGATGGSGTREAPFGDLPEAAAVATPGSCIALSAGRFQGAALPPSVSLLGKGADKTRIIGGVARQAALSVSGSDVLVRGVRLGGLGSGLSVRDSIGVELSSLLVDGVLGMGISVEDATGIRMEKIRVVRVAPATEAPDDVGVGVLVKRGQDIHLRRILIEHCQGSGLIHYGNDLLVEESVVRKNSQYGVAASCWPKPCTVTPLITIRKSLIEENRGVALWLTEVDARLEDVRVRRTGRSDTGFSRSLEGVDLPDLQVQESRFEAGADLGVFLHRSNAVITDTRVAGHGGRGMWIQSPGSTPGGAVEILGSEISGNSQVGIAVLGQCHVTLVESEVVGTVLDSLMTDSGSVTQGDGLQALPGSTIAVDRVLFQGNGRQSILADDVAHLTVVGSTFLDVVPDPIAVQNIGVTSIDQATNIESQGNLGVGGTGVSPAMPPHPLGADKSEIGISPALVF